MVVNVVVPFSFCNHKGMSGNKSMGKCTFLRYIIFTIVLHTKGETIQGNFFILKKLVEAPSKD
jgi:hypothetical protein